MAPQPSNDDRHANVGSRMPRLTESQSAYWQDHHQRAPDPSTSEGSRQMKNTHQQDRVAADRNNPPSGRNDDDTHALRAGKQGPTQRKSTHEREPSTRDAGSDDRRSGSESGKS